MSLLHCFFLQQAACGHCFSQANQKGYTSRCFSLKRARLSSPNAGQQCPTLKLRICTLLPALVDEVEQTVTNDDVAKVFLPPSPTPHPPPPHSLTSRWTRATGNWPHFPALITGVLYAAKRSVFQPRVHPPPSPSTPFPPAPLPPSSPRQRPVSRCSQTVVWRLAAPSWGWY